MKNKFTFFDSANFRFQVNNNSTKELCNLKQRIEKTLQELCIAFILLNLIPHFSPSDLFTATLDKSEKRNQLH